MSRQVLAQATPKEQGKLKAIKTGAGWRVKREELERYVKKL